MKSLSTITRTLTFGVAAAGLVAGAAWAQAAVTPKLAAGVKPAPGYETTSERFVTANPTPIFSDISETSKTTGQLDRIGEPVNVLAKVPGWGWILVGKDGVGVGYVPRSLLRPATS